MKVFISSTYDDLRRHRNVLSQVLRQAAIIPVGMEDFGARTQSSVNESLDEVAAADAFVGIYAHRYGTVPAGATISISEAEYVRACDVGLPTFIYLLDPDHPWPDEYRDSPERGASLASFKARLGDAHVVKRFGEPHDLASSVAADLHRHWSRRNLADLRPRELRERDPLFDSSVSEELTPDPTSWNQDRFGIYQRQRNVFLHYEIEPSIKAGQSYDITLFLIRKSSTATGLLRDDLYDVTYADFFLGPHWRDRVFRVSKSSGRIGLVVSTFGEMLVFCRVQFRDGYTCDIHQFVRFPTG